MYKQRVSKRFQWKQSNNDNSYKMIIAVLESKHGIVIVGNKL